MATKDYTLGSDELEFERLSVEGRSFDRQSKPFLAKFIRPGDRVLELGAGTGSASQIILSLLEHRGELHAVELQKNYADFIQTRLSMSGYQNFSVLNREIASLDTENDYDVIYGRAILHHLPRVEGIFESLKRMLKPGGLVAFEEPIVTDVKSIPHCQAYQDLADWYMELGKINQVDYMIGEKLAGYFRRFGFEIDYLQHVQATLAGDAERRVLHQILEVLKDQLLEHSIIDEETFSTALESLKQLVDDDTILYESKFCQIMGRVVS